MSCTCYIIPSDVLKKLAEDPALDAKARKAASDTVQISNEIRVIRDQARTLTGLTMSLAAAPAPLAPAPAVTVFDCKNHTTLPGTQVSNPGSSSDATAKRTFVETTAVADFYKKTFGRNSIDNAGMTLLSSIHYGVNFNNAMWNGSQMIYGDGDSKLFVDFTKGDDVIGHELTHGVTQFTLQLVYANESGGLNESMSDCFGSMFRQWKRNQDVNHADWLIGHDIMGSVATSKGFTCLRDMSNPAAAHCLAPQPTKFSQITPGMDPHFSSGPPNLAFFSACKKVGGHSWEKVGQVWYRVLTTTGPTPNMTMKAFAAATRKLAKSMFTADASVFAGIDFGWKQVGL